MGGDKSVAIIGAGPIGIEAALRAADQGYPVTVYEAGREVAAHVRDWAHVPLFTSWDMSISPLARRTISDLPTGDGCPTGAQLADATDRLAAALPAGTVRLSTRIEAVGRAGLVKSDEIGTPRRAHQPFRLLACHPDGSETVEQAQVVVDCTGSYALPNALGNGGVPAPGERTLHHRIQRRIPDLNGGDRALYAGRKILLVGAGKSAQTAARDLADLAASEPDTSVIWAVRSDNPSWGEVAGDPLLQRQGLVDLARKVAGGHVDRVQLHRGVCVDGLHEGTEGHLTVRLSDGTQVTVDQILALVGSVGDAGLHRQLQVHQCYATEGVMNLAAQLLAETGGDCLTQSAKGIEALRNPEPDFFILGSKAYGRNNTFLLHAGWEQVDQVLTALAIGARDREPAIPPAGQR